MEGRNNPRTAATLSVIPGLGQVYNLQPRKGVLFFIVGTTNLFIFSILCLGKQITDLISNFGKEYGVLPNQDLIHTFSELSIHSPSVLMLLFLFLAFLTYTVRDAHDQAKGRMRSAIYKDTVIEIAEANSASYLFHISLMVSFLILAFFFILPPPPKVQVTDIEFLSPQEKTEKNIETTKKSINNSEAKRSRDRFRPGAPGSTSSTSSTSNTASPQRPRTVQQPRTETKPRAESKPPAPAQAHRENIMPRPVAPSSVNRARSTPMPLPQPNNAKPLSNTAMPSLSQMPVNRTASPAGRTMPVPITSPQRIAMAPQPNAIPLQLGNTNGPALPRVTSGGASKSADKTATPSMIPLSSMETARSTGGPRGTGHTPVERPGKSKSDSGSNSKVPGPDAAPSNKHQSGNGMKDLISIKPNVGSPARAKEGNGGNPTDGPISETPGIKSEKEVDFSRYMADLQRRIKRNWFPPKEDRSKRVKVIFSIADNGALANLRLERSSGSAIADQAALTAVRRAAPFANLPPGAPASVDVSFTFDYNVFQGGGARRF